MIEKLFKKISTFHILVIGDVMIDSYWRGRVSRISPEAPVPILDLMKKEYRLGGAANVAMNVKSLGANPILCSVIGEDEFESLFLKLLQQYHLSNEGIVSLPSRQTTIKHRMIANNSQMFRVDEENNAPLTEQEEEQFLKRVDNILSNNKIDAIILEDYDKGVLSPHTIAHIVSEAQKKKIIVSVDPKKRNFHHYQGVTLFKPNLKELKEGLEHGDKELKMEDIHQLMRKFSQGMNMDYLMTTLSERGVAMYDNRRDKFMTYPAFLRKIADVSGAGDTVIAVATLSLLSGVSVEILTQVANLAGGIVCEYAGVVPIQADELKEQLQKEKLFDK